jgi:polyisoprenoid-binding protein YceI
VVLVTAALLVWWFVLRSDTPPAVSLDEAVVAATSTTGAESASTGGTEAPTTTGAATDSTSADTTAPGTAGDDADGEWIPAADGRSFAGYRVNEELASIGFFTAAGRTTGIAGRLVIDGDSVPVVEIVVDMTGLQSDSSFRDGALRRQALETSDFPTASFTLAEPIRLPDGALSGEPFAVDAIGDLEIHGVTNRVTIPLDAQLVEGAIAVVGSTEILFADYDIDKPSAAAVLSVEDRGIMEFQIVFTRG